MAHPIYNIMQLSGLLPCIYYDIPKYFNIIHDVLPMYGPGSLQMSIASVDTSTQ